MSIIGDPGGHEYDEDSNGDMNVHYCNKKSNAINDNHKRYVILVCQLWYAIWLQLKTKIEYVSFIFQISFSRNQYKIK